MSSFGVMLPTHWIRKITKYRVWRLCCFDRWGVYFEALYLFIFSRFLCILGVGLSYFLLFFAVGLRNISVFIFRLFFGLCLLGFFEQFFNYFFAMVHSIALWLWVMS